jgi:hypothetical protein
MAIIQMHEGGLTPYLYSQDGRNPQGLPDCATEDAVVNHNIPPYQHLIKHFKTAEFNDAGCACKDCPPVAVGDVITLAKVPAGQALTAFKWNVYSPDPTFAYDLELRNTSDLTVAGDALGAVTANAQQDGMAFPNAYRSLYNVPCTGKDCEGAVENYQGRDHGMIVAVVTALPTGGQGGCALKCSPLGSHRAKFHAIITDLR